MSEKIKVSKEEYEEEKAKIERIRKEINTLESQIGEASRSLENSRKEHDDVRAQYSPLKEALDRAKDDLNRVSGALDKLRTQRFIYRIAYLWREAYLRFILRRRALNRVTWLRSQTIPLEKRIEELRNRITGLETGRGDLRRTLVSFRDRLQIEEEYFKKKEKRPKKGG